MRLISNCSSVALPLSLTTVGAVVLLALVAAPDWAGVEPLAPVPDDAPPEGELEEMVAATWAEVLRLPRVGRHQGFFAAGGDSLLATVLVERLRIPLGVVVSLRELLANATVAQLAAAIAPRVDVESLGAVDEGIL